MSTNLIVLYSHDDQVAAGEAREYGHAMVARIAANKDAGADLLGKLPDSTKMWMSHGDKLTAVPQVTQAGLVFFRAAKWLTATRRLVFTTQPRTDHRLPRNDLALSKADLLPRSCMIYSSFCRMGAV